MEDESRFQINMPANVKVRVEIINGIGIKEMITTAIAGIVAVFIALIFNTIFNNVLIINCSTSIYILTFTTIANKIITYKIGKIFIIIPG